MKVVESRDNRLSKRSRSSSSASRRPRSAADPGVCAAASGRSLQEPACWVILRSWRFRARIGTAAQPEEGQGRDEYWHLVEKVGGCEHGELGSSENGH